MWALHRSLKTMRMSVAFADIRCPFTVYIFFEIFPDNKECTFPYRVRDNVLCIFQEQVETLKRLCVSEGIDDWKVFQSLGNTELEGVILFGSKHAKNGRRCFRNLMHV